MSKFEFRVVWQREGHVQQVKRYAKLGGAILRHGLLTSPTPWEFLGKKASDWVCCGGRECGCGGETFQAKTERIAQEGPLRYVRMECRVIGEWEKYEPAVNGQDESNPAIGADK